MPTNVRDPRTIITPDAFGIAPDLLGTPLARPGARFWAMLIDLTVVGILTAMLGGVGLFIWGVVALLFVGLAFQKTTGRRNRTVSVVLRASTGCLGAGILSVVLLVWFFAALSDGDDEDRSGPVRLQRSVGEEAFTADVTAADLARLLGEGFSGMRSLGRAETAAEAEDAAFRLLLGVDDLDLDDEERLGILDEMTPADAPWADDADAIYRRALERWEASSAGESGEEVGAGEADPPAGAPTVADSVAAVEEVEALDDREVLARYGASLGADSGNEGGATALGRRLLRRRALEILAEDTLAVLEDELRRVREDLAEEEARRRAVEAEAQAGGNAFVALLRDVWDQLGSAIGLWSFYFTALLTLFGGRTVGKRALGIRVVRLDGEAMTWWSSFERAGGYVAGLATGLLGFAQVFWDPNRQCIHDKIVGTVVVDDRAERVPGSWKEAWVEGGGPDGPSNEQEEEA